MTPVLSQVTKVKVPTPTKLSQLTLIAVLISDFSCWCTSSDTAGDLVLYTSLMFLSAFKSPSSKCLLILRLTSLHIASSRVCKNKQSRKFQVATTHTHTPTHPSPHLLLDAGWFLKEPIQSVHNRIVKLVWIFWVVQFPDIRTTLLGKEQTRRLYLTLYRYPVRNWWMERNSQPVPSFPPPVSSASPLPELLEPPSFVALLSAFLLCSKKKRRPLAISWLIVLVSWKRRWLFTLPGCSCLNCSLNRSTLYKMGVLHVSILLSGEYFQFVAPTGSNSSTENFFVFFFSALCFLASPLRIPTLFGDAELSQAECKFFS